MNDEAKFLIDDEIDKFLSTLDTDKDGCISYKEIERGLDAAHEELVTNVKDYHRLHYSGADIERHDFLRRVTASEKDKIPASDFKNIVRSWKIPSLEQGRKGAKGRR